MTRRELATQIMKAEGSTDEVIAKTLRTFDAMGAPEGWIDSEILPDEEEAVRRMFKKPSFLKPNN